jgi:hypothetical protein
MTGQEMVYPPMDERLATDEQFGTSIERVEAGAKPEVITGQSLAATSENVEPRLDRDCRGPMNATRLSSPRSDGRRWGAVEK